MEGSNPVAQQKADSGAPSHSLTAESSTTAGQAIDAWRDREDGATGVDDWSRMCQDIASSVKLCDWSRLTFPFEKARVCSPGCPRTGAPLPPPDTPPPTCIVFGSGRHHLDGALRAFSPRRVGASNGNASDSTRVHNYASCGWVNTWQAPKVQPWLLWRASEATTSSGSSASASMTAQALQPHRQMQDEPLTCTGLCGKCWDQWEDVPYWSKTRPRKPWCDECGMDKPGWWNNGKPIWGPTDQ